MRAGRRRTLSAAAYLPSISIVAVVVGRLVDHLCRQLSARFRVETIAGEQGVCLSTSLTRVRYPAERARVPREQALGCGEVGGTSDVLRLPVRSIARVCLAPLRQDEVDRGPVDALSPQLD